MTTYVLVHGGFVDGWYWGETAALLEKEGHQVLVADLPSTGTDPAALGDLFADAATVRDLLGSAEGPVVLVGHSYGGAVITEVADHPAIARTVYLSAFWPGRGQSLFDMIGGELPENGWIVPTEDGTASGVSGDRELVRQVLAADMDSTRFAEQIYGRFMLSSAAAMSQASSAPDRTHPVTYVVLEQDNAIPKQAQEAMSAQADDVRRLPTSHSPMLVDPEGLATLLARMA